MSFSNLEIGTNSVIRDSGSYFLNCKKLYNSIIIKSGANVDLVVNNSESVYSIDFVLEDNAIVRVGIINSSDSKNHVFTAKIAQNSNISFNIADFNSGKSSFKIDGYLLGENAQCYCHVATSSDNKDIKDFIVNIYHENKATTSKAECYGVSKGTSNLTFSGVSHIKNGCIKSSTNQIAKAMVFDPASIAIAKPILKIDENDVIASHSAAVGKINDEHLFYLMSRGLSEEQARQIITLGYLKPIINKFDESFHDEIYKLIERSL